MAWARVRRAVLAGAPLALAVVVGAWIATLNGRDAGRRPQDDAFGPFLPPSVALTGIEAQAAELLRRNFLRLGYDIGAVGAGRGVPRIILASLPPDLSELDAPAARKEVFLAAMLPLVLQVNEEIASRRRRLEHIRAGLAAGQPLDAGDRAWLHEIAAAYGVPDPDPDILMPRIDQIPVSLALAQAAEESGWGTSRFARDGNALFGQWSFGEAAMRPRQASRDGYGVRAFDNLLEAVRAYARNLNTHAAYREFRQARAALRRAGKPLDGHALAGTLTRYSARGPAYVRSLRAIIAANGLGALDAARFAGLRRERRS